MEGKYSIYSSYVIRYCWGFSILTGGLTGILGDSALDINVHDTYFMVGHFHIVMGLSAIYGMLAGVYHWFPKCMEE